MRLLPQTSVGIEIVDQDLRIAVVRDFAGKRRLLRMDVLADFLALSEEDRVGILAAHFKKNKLSGFNVHLTFPGRCGVARDLEIPAAAGIAADLRSAVALQVENLSPWPLDEIYWDCAWEPPTKSTRTIIVHVGIVPRQVVDPWIGLFRSAGLALTRASLSSLSWAHGAFAFWGAAQPTLVVAAEKGYVEGTLNHHGKIYTVSIEGEQVPQRVSACASQLLRAGRIDATQELRVFIQDPSAPDQETGKVQLPIGGRELIKNGFGAISTALLGLARSGFRLNLIPGPLRYQRNRLQVVPTYILAASLVLLAVFGWLREPYQQWLYAARLDQETKRIAVEVRSVADQETQLNRASDRLKALNTLISNRDANLEALRELSRALPAGSFFTSYSYQDKIVTVGGLSDGAAAIQKAFEGSAILHDAQFTSSITRDNTGKDRFTMRMSAEVKR